MSFLTLATTVGVLVLIASLITNMLRGVILALSGLGILFYLFVATPAQKNQMDSFASNISLPSSLEIQNIDVMPYINQGVSSSVKIFEDTAKDFKK